jgi:hypothetical protein
VPIDVTVEGAQQEGASRPKGTDREVHADHARDR